MRYSYPKRGGSFGHWFFSMLFRFLLGLYRERQKQKALEAKHRKVALDQAIKAQARLEAKTKTVKPPKIEKTPLGPRPNLAPAPEMIETVVRLKTPAAKTPKQPETDLRLEDLTSMLKNLGCKKAMATEIAKKTLEQMPDAPLEKLVVEALRRTRS